MLEEKSNVLAGNFRKQSEFSRKLDDAREILKVKAAEGGRYLRAIWTRKDLSTSQKVILQQIAASITITKGATDFTAPVSLSLNDIAERASMQARSVRRIIRELEALGLLITNHKENQKGGAISSDYRLSRKLFHEYVRVKIKPRKPVTKGEDIRSGGAEPLTVIDGEGGGHTVPPPKEKPVTPADKLGENPRGGRTYGPGGEDIRSVLFPNSSSKGSKSNPPISPFRGKGDSVNMRISRYDKTDLDYLASLAISTWRQWREYGRTENMWKSTGFASLRDLLAAYYPEVVVRLMPKLGPKWENGIGKGDKYFWRKEVCRELDKWKGKEVDLASITDFPFLELDDLVARFTSI